jgi:hypothetical protein
MEVRLIKHIPEANSRFVEFVKATYHHLVAYYERGDWVRSCNTHDLVNNFISLTLGQLAFRYMPELGYGAQYFEQRFVLITRRAGFKTDQRPMVYPVGFDLISADPGFEMKHAIEVDSDLLWIPVLPEGVAMDRMVDLILFNE